MEQLLAEITLSNCFFIWLSQHCFCSLRFLGMCLTTSLLRFPHSTSNWLSSELWLSHYNTLILFQSFCCSCASFSYCVIQLALTVRQITFDCWMILYTEDHMADSLTESFPGPVASKQTQIVIFQPPNWQLVWSVQIIFSLNATVWAKITTLVSFCPKDIVLELLWFIQIQSKPKLCSYVLFRK